MKLLMGSQNFGYDTKDSDKDWMKIIYPTWRNILDNELTLVEVTDSNGISKVKIKDIRALPEMLYKGNFSDTQILFSQEMYDCDDLKWFFDNKQELLRCNLWNCFKSNAGCIGRMSKEDSVKSTVRAYAFLDYLKQLKYGKDLIMRKPEFRELRLKLTQDKLQEENSRILEEVMELEEWFIRFKDKPDKHKLEQMKLKVIELMQKKLK